MKEHHVLSDNAYESPGMVEGNYGNGDGYDYSHDVFGTEEGHDVRLCFYICLDIWP